MPTQPIKRSSTTTGRAGEEAAIAFLEAQGYQIVDVNVRFGRTQGIIGELDIVAWDGPTLCFIEVKTRRLSSEEAIPAVAVTLAKQQQIAALAVAYAARYGLLSGPEEIPLRFDVVSVLLNGQNIRQIDLIQAAFLTE